MRASSLYEAMAMKCLAGSQMTMVATISAVDAKVSVDLLVGAKYASLRRLKEAGLAKEVKDPSTNGKVLELTEAGKDELEQIENFWRS
jgi:DNA-binding PadR family transcriptional regulator